MQQQPPHRMTGSIGQQCGAAPVCATSFIAGAEQVKGRHTVQRREPDLD